MRVGVHVERPAREARQWWVDEFAAERTDQTVVAERAHAAVRGAHQHFGACGIDLHHLAFDPLDAGRREHVVERHARVAQVRLVVAHANGVIRVAVDERDADRIWCCAAAVNGSRRAECAPQAGEAAAEDEDALDRHGSLRGAGIARALVTRIDDMHKDRLAWTLAAVSSLVR